MPLAKAQKLAERIAGEITGYCHQVEIAGSIRRRRPDCGDIDLVVLPKDGMLAALQERFKLHCKVHSEGRQNAIYVLPNEVQVDVFFAYQQQDLLTPMTTNWGSLLLCRTGSTQHNIYLVQHAKMIDLIWRPYAGVFSTETGEFLAGVTERDIFTALRLDYVRPEERER
jgi:DNA polymerase/3'-5' exonuclease PolX